MTVLAWSIQHKRGLTAEWVGDNPVLLEGQMGFEKEGDYFTKVKVGNGVDEWNNLPYFSSGGSATVGLNEIAYGDNVDGTITSSTNFTFDGNAMLIGPDTGAAISGESYLTVSASAGNAKMLVFNTNASGFTGHLFGESDNNYTSILRYGSTHALTDVPVIGGSAANTTRLNNIAGLVERSVISLGADNVLIYNSDGAARIVLATQNKAVNFDDTGLKISDHATANTPNAYPFQCIFNTSDFILNQNIGEGISYFAFNGVSNRASSRGLISDLSSFTGITDQNSVQFTIGDTSTNMALRVDAIGGRFGPYSSMATTNSWKFEITDSIYLDNVYTFYNTGSQSFVQIAPGQAQFGNFSSRVSIYGSEAGGNTPHMDFTTNNILRMYVGDDRIDILRSTKIAAEGAPLIINSTNNNAGKLAFQDNGTLVSYFGGGLSQPAVWYMPNGDEILSSDPNRKITVQKINIVNIPTSASGLVSGDVWSDGGTLKIVT